MLACFFFSPRMKSLLAAGHHPAVSAAHLLVHLLHVGIELVLAELAILVRIHFVEMGEQHRHADLGLILAQEAVMVDVGLVEAMAHASLAMLLHLLLMQSFDL